MWNPAHKTIALTLALCFVPLPLELLANSEPGDRVECDWQGRGRYYPGFVYRVHDSSLSIAYDDDDVEETSASRCRSLSDGRANPAPLQGFSIGSRVECNWKGRGRFYPGYVGRISNSRLFIVYDDGDTEETTPTLCRHANPSPVVEDQEESPALNGVPITGHAVPELQAFDRAMSEFVSENQVPGASLALVKNGHIVYARGFGYADRDARQVVQPTSVFRMQSLSKSFTAIAIMQLVEQGRIRLDTKIYDYLGYTPFLQSGDRFDERWRDITVRDCLHHTGGWDRSASFDPLYRTSRIARTMGVSGPANEEQIIRYMMGQPLDFDPKERYAYSNLGYLILGQVIEKASGETYADRVTRRVFAPLGMRGMQPGQSGLDGRLLNEVTYYSYENKMTRAWFGPRRGQSVPHAYTLPMELRIALGGWTGTIFDLGRFVSALDHERMGGVLNPQTFELMQERPPGPAGLESDGSAANPYYGMGMHVRAYTRTKNLWHSGGHSHCCSSRYAYIESRRFGWAVLFNTRKNAAGEKLTSLIGDVIYGTERQISTWPTNRIDP